MKKLTYMLGAIAKTISITALVAITIGCPPERTPDNSENKTNGPEPPRITAPDVPSGLTTTPENGQITIVWDASARATSYDIFRVMGMDGAIGEDAEPYETIPAGSEHARRYVDGGLTKGAVYGYAIAAINGAGSSGLSDIVYEEAVEIVDIDGDGLIEIGSLERLDAIRYDLEGVSYKVSMSDTGNSRGCPEMGGCNGYELTRSLDFDEEASYASGMVNEAWRPDNTTPDMADNPGWIPIGACADDTDDSGLDRCGDDDDQPFSAIFEGNGHTITGLYTRGSGEIGLFGLIDEGATIRDLGVLNGNIYSGSESDTVGALVGLSDGRIIACNASGTVNGDEGNDNIGLLVGENSGRIIASYTSGTVNGNEGQDSVGALVGENSGRIIACNASGTVNGDEDNDSVGALVGENSGRIIASYTSGTVNGDEGNDNVGALVGENGGGLDSVIIASYSRGDAFGGSDSDNVGGLLGVNAGRLPGSVDNMSRITASYATGNVYGGRDADAVGGLVGLVIGGDSAFITASYATGDVYGDDQDGVGALIGALDNPTIIEDSYGFGVVNGGALRNTEGAPPLAITRALEMTRDNVGRVWDTGRLSTAGAWDFGDNTQAPALRYADYDGSSSEYDCADYPCGTLIPGQGR